MFRILPHLFGETLLHQKFATFTKFTTLEQLGTKMNLLYLRSKGERLKSQ